MFNRLHHQKIEKVLRIINPEILAKTNCYFGGGTAIALSLNEYRESIDIDFLCASIEGYSYLRRVVNENDFGILFNEKLACRRGIRSDRYGIRASIDVEGVPINIEFVSEGRIQISGDGNTICNVATLSRTDMFAEKLLANADRWGDKSILSRDIIDIAMMIDSWGQIPDEAFQKTIKVYGEDINRALLKASSLIADNDYLQKCISGMKMDASLAEQIRVSLGVAPPVEKYLDDTDF